MFVESKGVDLQQQFLGYRRKEINSLGQFLVTLEVEFCRGAKQFAFFLETLKNEVQGQNKIKCIFE